MFSVLVPALLASSYALAQGNGAPPVITTTDAATATTSVGASQKSATSALKLAKKYTVNEFLNDFDFFDDADPTNGYVNYVSKSDAQSLGLVSEVNGRFIMAADSTSRSIGRGRNSVRISSKAQWADGVYILDLNHMPVGCGTWPAFWTVVKDGWPKGGEIDIMEGANTYPSLNSNSYSAIESVGFQNASAGYPTVNNVASLHTSSQCYLNSNAYMTGTVGANTCSAYENGNTGCGVIFGGKTTYGTTSFGSGVNDAGGGWFAMWRDLENSGGVYIYYWPRNATNIPDDVTNADTQTTNVADWGQPGANLTVPCSSDFDNHVIVFNIAFCGDYAGNTYTQSGCPQTCQTFVQNYPAAFGEAYWSINSLRVYTASGKPASTGSGLSGGAIAGIVIGVLAGLALLLFGIWRYRRNRNARRMFAQSPTSLDTPTFPQSRKQSTAWAGLDDSELLTASALHEPKKKHSIASFISGNSDSVPTSRRGSRSGSVAGAAYSPSTGARLATKKARTGRTVLRPGMTAQNFLDGETPIGGADEREDDPVQMGGFVMKPKSTPGWAG